MSNPNAAVGTVSTIGGGEIVVNIAKLFGWSISTGWGIAIAGALSGLVLFIGREGVVGVWNTVVHGSKKPPAVPPAPPTTVAPPGP